MPAREKRPSDVDDVAKWSVVSIIAAAVAGAAVALSVAVVEAGAIPSGLQRVAHLAELMMAAIAFGCCRVAWTRWQQPTLAFPGRPQPYRGFAAIAWVAWLAVTVGAIFAVVTSAIAASGWLAALGRQPNAPPNTPTTLSSSYFGLLAFLFAIVTGFYFLLLHRAQDHARQVASEARAVLTATRERAESTLDAARAQVDELEQLLGAGGSVYEVTLRHHIQLTNEIVAPMLGWINALHAYKLPEPGEAELTRFREQSRRLLELLKAEVVLFAVAEAATTQAAVSALRKLSAYEHVFEERDMGSLWRLAIGRVEQLLSLAVGDEVGQLRAGLTYLQQEGRRHR